MINRNANVAIKLFPYELASEFCEMDGAEQAEFFNEISRLVKDWESPFCMQLQNVSDSEVLTREGRYIMKQIGDYAE